ncbi:MAG: hypothetical protein BGO41_15810 [Clostridiales bacterium 38-18]|nr:MAG: hypothetical protein BGO41_15810 [Clostridiales bacterium 38-18]
MDVNKICIVCPKGCHLNIEMNRDNAFLRVTGNLCIRGEQYAREEIDNPKRIITTTIKVIEGSIKRVPIKTATSISKSQIEDFITSATSMAVNAPVYMGDVLTIDGIQMKYICVIGRTVLKVDTKL